jgi:hypothetical protein
MFLHTYPLRRSVLVENPSYIAAQTLSHYIVFSGGNNHLEENKAGCIQ